VRLFDGFVDASASLAPPVLRRSVMARRDLTVFTHPSSRKLRTLLGLPVEDPATTQKPAKTRKGTKERAK
jgi:hypothetical protein